jgi:hypothetical protein
MAVDGLSIGKKGELRKQPKTTAPFPDFFQKTKITQGRDDARFKLYKQNMRNKEEQLLVGGIGRRTMDDKSRGGFTEELRLGTEAVIRQEQYLFA